MAVYNPPIETLPIFDNTVFSTTSLNSTLTQAQANLLYLRKNYTDTATALETFTAGIATNNIATTTLASNLQIGSATNTGTIFISTIATNNSNADPAISIGGNAGVKTIKINNGTNSVHCSSIDIAGSGINNVTNISGSIDIGNLQTTGVLNLGANTTRTITGAINIGTGSTIANPINLGSTTSIVAIKGPATNAGTFVSTGIITGNGGILTPTLNPITAASSLFIGDASTTGNIAIKGTDGASGILAICDGPTTSTAINIGSNACITKIRGLQILDAAAASTLDIAATQTSGVLNIGIGSRVTTGSGGGINIGTGSGGTANPIIIGGTASPISLAGPVSLSKPLILGSIPTASTQLGYTFLGSISSNIITPSVVLVQSVPTTSIPDGLTINIQTITLPAGSWLLIAQGRIAITATISFAQPTPLRYNITSSSQVYAGASTYCEYNNLTFLSPINTIPYSNFSTYVQPSVSTNYYLTVSPQYGNGAATSLGTNIQIGSEMTLKAVRIA